MKKSTGLLLWTMLSIGGGILTGFAVFYPENIPYPFPENLLHFPPMPQSRENPVSVGGAELGRFLFYDPILSADSSISCASCHQQQFAFADMTQFSRGFNNRRTQRNTPPLFNLAWYPNLFWDGRVSSMEAQALHPVRTSNEMNLDWETAAQRIRQSEFYRSKFQMVFGEKAIDSTLIGNAIAQFERTLLSYNSKYDKVLRGEAFFEADEYEGFNLMNDQIKGNCLHCHTTDANALGTTTLFSNNGLDTATKASEYSDKGKGGITQKSEDFGWFKTPSLRNVAVTAPYMHDGRFQTLEEVLEFYSENVQESYNLDPKMGGIHGNGANLTQEERKKVIAFLKTLTDSVFLNQSKFGNPFNHYH